MIEECPAGLRMIRVILKDGLFDDLSYNCKIIRYNPEEESIYLLTGKVDLPTFSLDAVYECTISLPDGPLICSGTIRERYWSKAGRVILFRVENGFYKNNLNSIKVC